jgi:hypothetical protein
VSASTPRKGGHRAQHLDPQDRVRELGDAAVPFRYDVHALFFSDDAVRIETELHRRFAPQRINRVNLRREFFRVTPSAVREQLVELAGESCNSRSSPKRRSSAGVLTHIRVPDAPGYKETKPTRDR